MYSSSIQLEPILPYTHILFPSHSTINLFATQRCVCTYPRTDLPPTDLPTDLPTYRPTDLPTYQRIHLMYLIYHNQRILR